MPEGRRRSGTRLAIVAALAFGACATVRPAAPAPATASAPAVSAPPSAPATPTPPAIPTPTVRPAPPPDTIVLVAVGDVGLNRSNLPVDPRGVLEGGAVTPWADMTAHLPGLIDGDLNFMNLETVVTARNDLAAGDKGQAEPFLFRSHPEGVEHVVSMGFNLVSGANNHAYDYGEAGVRDTVASLAPLVAAGRIHVAGIGLDRDEASRPAEIALPAGHVAFSAIGNVTNMINAHRAGEHKPGTMGYRHPEDWELVTSRLAATPADLRILSIHYGLERDIRVDARQREEYRFAISARGVDVVLGHHAHVVRGIELHAGKPIFYGLGNFLIRGAADIGTRPDQRVCCDFGLLARVHFKRGPDGHYQTRAIEVVPMTAMNRAPEPMAVEEAGRRVEVLNVLAESLDDAAVDSVGVRFAVRPNGTGLFCVDGAAADPGAVGALCADYHGPTPATAEVRARVRAAPDPVQIAKQAALDAKKAKQAKRGKAGKRGKPGNATGAKKKRAVR